MVSSLVLHTIAEYSHPLRYILIHSFKHKKFDQQFLEYVVDQGDTKNLAFYLHRFNKIVLKEYALERSVFSNQYHVVKYLLEILPQSIFVSDCFHFAIRLQRKKIMKLFMDFRIPLLYCDDYI